MIARVIAREKNKETDMGTIMFPCSVVVGDVVESDRKKYEVFEIKYVISDKISLEAIEQATTVISVEPVKEGNRKVSLCND